MPVPTHPTKEDPKPSPIIAYERVKKTRHTLRDLFSRLGTFTIALILAGVVFSAYRTRHLESIPTEIVSGAAVYTVCSRTGKSIYTVDELRPSVECLVVNRTSGLILSTGSLGTLRANHGRTPIFYTPKGAIVVPGMTDSHVHMLHYGWSRALNLEGSASIDEVRERVKAYVRDREGSDPNIWIEGVGWDQSLWPSGQFPSSDDLELDPYLRGRPIVLHRKDLHAAWVSAKILELTKPYIPRNKKVNGGEIIVDAKGRPTGVFLDNAIQLIPIPEWTENKMKDYFQIATSDALALGLTSVHDALSLEPHLKFYDKLANEGTLPIRLYAMASRDDGPYWGKDFVHYKRHNSGKDGRFNVKGVKLIADGAIGSWGAKMYQPFDDNPTSTGFFRFPLERLKKEIPKFVQDGWQVNVHCIGDRANGEVLDILESTFKDSNTTALRPRIEHAQIVRPQDFERFGRIGVIASVQPTHATSDMLYTEERIGKRAEGALAFRSILDSHGRITLGTDFPVESANPMYTFYAAITRLDTKGHSPHGPNGWYPKQKLTREETLKGMTLDPAFASFSEDRLGSLVVGKLADFVVLDRDIMKIPALEILETRVLATVLSGNAVYSLPM